MKHLYAEKTTVQVSKSRGQIDILLRTWGCKQIQWTDDYDAGVVMLRFVMPVTEAGEGEQVARLSIGLRPEGEIREMSAHGRTGEFLQAKYDKLMNARGQQEHRLLLLWIKAALNTVDAGLLSTLEVFLPFVEDSSGKTVGEVVIPRLKMGERNLLPEGKLK